MRRYQIKDIQEELKEKQLLVLLLEPIKIMFKSGFVNGTELENILDFIECETDNKHILDIVKSCDYYLETHFTDNSIKEILDKINKIGWKLL